MFPPLPREGLGPGWISTISTFAIIGAISITAVASRQLTTPKFSLVRQLDHGSEISSIATSPAGRLVASVGNGSSVKIWELASGSLLHEIPKSNKQLKEVSFNRKGDLLAVADDEGTVQLFAVSTWELTRSLKPHLDDRTAVAKSEGPTRVASGGAIAFSPDGKKLAVGSFVAVVEKQPFVSITITEGKITLWDVETGEKELTLTNINTMLLFIAFSPDGRALITRNPGDSLSIWDTQTGKVRATLVDKRRDISGPLSFSQDGQSLASGAGDEIILWNVGTGSQLKILRGHKIDVSAVATAPNGKILASGDLEGVIKLWDLRTGKRLASWRGHTAGGTRVLFSPDGQSVVTAGGDNTIKVWRDGT